MGRRPHLTHFPRVCLEVNQRLVVAGDPPALSSPPPVLRGDTTAPGQVSRGLAVAPGSPGGVGPRRGRSGVSHGRRAAASEASTSLYHIVNIVEALPVWLTAVFPEF